jgi:ABC-type Mn2+/Zn2+ transport system permease subunit
MTLFLTFFLAFATYRQKLPNDSLIGIFYTSTMALGIIIHSLFSKSQSDLLSFLFGNILLLSVEDVTLSFGLFVATALCILIPFKKWLYLTYDEEGAITSGLNASFYHYLFFLIMAFLIVTSVKLAGTILVETLLLVPGFFALRFAKTIRQTFLYSLIFSCLMSVLGIFLANAFGLPSGATLAAVLFLGLVVSLFIKYVYNLIRK